MSSNDKSPLTDITDLNFPELLSEKLAKYEIKCDEWCTKLYFI